MNHDAIRNINPAVVTIRGDVAYDANEQVIEIDQAAYDAEVARLEAEWNAKEYARLRKTEYDKLNQYEMMFDDQVNGTTTWVDAINAIKAKYPKG